MGGFRGFRASGLEFTGVRTGWVGGGRTRGGGKGGGRSVSVVVVVVGF